MSDMNIASLIIFFANSVLYFFIGHSLGKKSFENNEDASAWRAYRTWWFGMSANTALNGLAVLLLGLGASYLPVFVMLSLGATLAAAAALWGLLTYLMYIFRGSHTASRWIAGFYIAFGLFLFVSIYVFHPIGITMGTWDPQVQYENAPQGVFGLVYGVLLIVLLSLPPILASFGMFSLYFKLSERSARFRSLLVPLGIFALFGLAYFIPLILILVGINLSATSWWPLTIRLVGIAALMLIYFAYFPPAFIRRQLQVKGILE